MLVIRPPARNEQGQWVLLWQKYLAFYGQALDNQVTELTWLRFHAENEPMYCLGAFEGPTMLAFVTYVLHRSTWAIDHYCYLEDLFVDEAHRGKGVARQLIQGVNADATQRRCTRLYWVTRDSNNSARGLYDKLAERTDFLQYRMPLAIQ